MERRLVAEAASHEALPCPVRGLELVLYAREELAVPAYQLNLNTGPRMERRLSYDAGEEPRFWFLLDLAIAREHGIALAGPPAREVLPEFPRELVLEALREALTWYAADGGDEAQTVLAACRAWAWASDGVWRSKGDAARWARGRLPTRGPSTAPSPAAATPPPRRPRRRSATRWSTARWPAPDRSAQAHRPRRARGHSGEALPGSLFARVEPPQRGQRPLSSARLVVHAVPNGSGARKWRAR